MNIRKTFVAVVAMAAVFLASGCKSGREYAGGETAGITGVSDTMTVDRVLVSADSLSGHEVVFEGVCTHICAHGGRKIFVMGSDDSKVLRVEADGFIGSFPEETVNSIVVVKGILAEDRIDEAYLDAWEQKIKETEAVNTASESSHCDAEQKDRRARRNRNKQPTLNIERYVSVIQLMARLFYFVLRGVHMIE